MGKIVNNYELLEQLGQGGMGVVYKARHIHFNEIFAIKKLWEQFSANEMVLKLFLNEAKILRILNHKNIVHVTDIFSLEDQNYIVMEYIDGRTLHEIIKKEVGPIRRERAIKLFKQMLEGVAYIHNQPTSIIHRDIKPLNLLVTEDDSLKITDFGIAKVLDTVQNASTVMKGTPVYMSPEQIIDPNTVDLRTDVYSLGMTFYEMLCGKTPFSGDKVTSPTAIYTIIMNGEVPAPTYFYPGISKKLSDYVMRAIHKDRYKRFASTSEMLIELERIEEWEGILGEKKISTGTARRRFDFMGLLSRFLPKPKPQQNLTREIGRKEKLPKTMRQPTQMEMSLKLEEPWHFSHLGKGYFLEVSRLLGFGRTLEAPIQIIYIGKSGVAYIEKNRGRMVNPNWAVILENGEKLRYQRNRNEGVLPGLWNTSNCHFFLWNDIREYFTDK